MYACKTLLATVYCRNTHLSSISYISSGTAPRCAAVARTTHHQRRNATEQGFSPFLNFFSFF
jgi:hypothetical protein